MRLVLPRVVLPVRPPTAVGPRAFASWARCGRRHIVLSSADAMRRDERQVACVPLLGYLGEIESRTPSASLGSDYRCT
jgi:hypothetical protein